VPSYRTIFYDELPAAMNRLLTDSSPEALARAAVTYRRYERSSKARGTTLAEIDALAEAEVDA
jgi:hypothetical protein